MFTLRVGCRQFTGLPDLAAVSAAYMLERNSGPVGRWAHTFRENRMPRGIVLNEAGDEIARVSYNGRVWSGTQVHPDADLLYDTWVRVQ